MKPRLSLSISIAAASLLAACSSLDLAERTLNGTVLTRGIVPAGAEVTVRLLDLNPRETVKNPLADMTPTAPRAVLPERVIAERTFTVPAQTSEPIPFQLGYSASDDELRHGLNLEARISQGGKLRHRTINAHVVTLASAPYPHEIAVEPLP